MAFEQQLCSQEFIPRTSSCISPRYLGKNMPVWSSKWLETTHVAISKGLVKESMVWFYHEILHSQWKGWGRSGITKVERSTECAAIWIHNKELRFEIRVRARWWLLKMRDGPPGFTVPSSPILSVWNFQIFHNLSLCRERQVEETFHCILNYILQKPSSNDCFWEGSLVTKVGERLFSNNPLHCWNFLLIGIHCLLQNVKVKYQASILFMYNLGVYSNRKWVENKHVIDYCNELNGFPLKLFLSREIRVLPRAVPLETSDGFVV